MFIHEIAPLSVWSQEVKDGYVFVQYHPTLPYVIFDYTPNAQFARHWNPVTLASRGLVVHQFTGEILARPFGKFFNSVEREAVELGLTGPVRVTDKMDGSMALSYWTPDGLRIATRGSFTSEPALHASKVLVERYEGKWTPNPELTYIWEIIYPENRIVVNYGEMDDIVLLAAINKETGLSVPAADLDEWLWQKVDEFPYKTFEDAIAAPERAGMEGVVIHFVDTDVRVKFKYDEYKSLHRVATGVTPRRIWEILRNGDDLDAWLVGQPDEFVEYVHAQRDKILAAFREQIRQAFQDFKDFDEVHGDLDDREYAKLVSQLPSSQRGNIFAVYRNKMTALAKTAWDNIRPPHEKGFWASQFTRMKAEEDSAE